jgi:hypothetical protein
MRLKSLQIHLLFELTMLYGEYGTLESILVIPNIVNRSWLERLCKEGTLCPQAPGDIAA